MCEPCAARMRVSVWAPCAARVNKFLLQWVRGPELVHIPSYQRTLGHTFATSHRSQMDALTVYWRKKNNCVNFSKAEQASHSFKASATMLKKQDLCFTTARVFKVPTNSCLPSLHPHPPTFPPFPPTLPPPSTLPPSLPPLAFYSRRLTSNCLSTFDSFVFQTIGSAPRYFFSFGNFETFYIIYFSPLLEILLLLDNIIFSCSLIYFPQRIWRK